MHTKKFNPIALRKAKIVCNFGLSECNRDNISLTNRRPPFELLGPDCKIKPTPLALLFYVQTNLAVLMKPMEKRHRLSPTKYWIDQSIAQI